MYEDEIWKPIPDYEGFYEVSNYGRVRGLKRGKILKPTKNDSRGYCRVHLSKQGVVTYPYIHQLVMQAFAGKPEGVIEVNHKNKITNDNRLCNLEWTTREENAYHRDHWKPKVVQLSLFDDKEETLF